MNFLPFTNHAITTTTTINPNNNIITTNNNTTITTTTNNGLPQQIKHKKNQQINQMQQRSFNNNKHNNNNHNNNNTMHQPRPHAMHHQHQYHQHNQHNQHQQQQHLNYNNNGNRNRSSQGWRSNYNRVRNAPQKMRTPSYNRVHYSRSSSSSDAPSSSSSTSSYPRTNQSSSREYKGILKWFDPSKQFGFIEYAQNGRQQKDLFVHQSAFYGMNISPQIIMESQGSLVTFKIDEYYDKQTRRPKMKAINVRLVQQSQSKHNINNNNNNCNNANQAEYNWQQQHQQQHQQQAQGRQQTVKEQQQTVKEQQISTLLSPNNEIKENNEQSSNDENPSSRDRPYKGTLLWFNEEKKFGFIQCDEEPDGNSAGDLFVYESELRFDRELLYKGMRLQFDIEIYTDYHQNQKRKAINVIIDIDDNESLISCTSYQSFASLSSQHSRSEGQENRAKSQIIPWRPHSIHNTNNNCNSSPFYRLTYGPSGNNGNNNSTNNNNNGSRNLEPEYKGYLLWFNESKRHGFIECDSQIIEDVFVYETDFRFPKRLIQAGMRLLFDIKHYKDAKNEDKRKAINVKIDQFYEEDDYRYDPNQDKFKAKTTEHGFAQKISAQITAKKTMPQVKVIETIEIQQVQHIDIKSMADISQLQMQNVGILQAEIKTNINNNTISSQVSSQISPQSSSAQVSAMEEHKNSESENSGNSVSNALKEKMLKAPEFVPSFASTSVVKTVSFSMSATSLKSFTKMSLEPIEEEEKEEAFDDEFEDEDDERIQEEQEREEEKQEMVEVTPKPKKKKKKKKKKGKKRKYNINVEQLFKNCKTDYKKIAEELFNIFVLKQNDYNLQDVFNKLFGLKKSIRNRTFLLVNLQFLSLIKEKFSIFDLIKHMDQTNIMSRYFTKLLNVTGIEYNQIRCQFFKYDLKCLYPSNMEMIDELIKNKRPINEFMDNKCYLYTNYVSMRKMLNYLIPKYCSNENENEINLELLRFIKLMVINDIDIDVDDDEDRDNNDKLLLLSFITSICNDHNLLQSQYENIIQQLKNNHILPYHIINEWRMDECDTLTQGKKQSLQILATKINDWDQNHRNMMNNYDDNDDDYDECDDDSLLGGYISRNDLMQQNKNHNINVSSNYCDNNIDINGQVLYSFV